MKLILANVKVTPVALELFFITNQSYNILVIEDTETDKIYSEKIKTNSIQYIKDSKVFTKYSDGYIEYEADTSFGAKMLADSIIKEKEKECT